MVDVGLLAEERRDELLRLSLPLPLALVGDLLGAIERVATKHGYTNVVMLTDGSNAIVGTRLVTRRPT